MHDRFPRFRRPRPLPPALADRLTAPPPAVPEAPGPDGIRWGLVNRVRAELAAGTYDTDARWALAEERLLRAAEAGP